MATTLAVGDDPIEALARRLFAVAERIGVADIETADSTLVDAELREQEAGIAARVAGDPSEFQVLYDRYYARILNYLFRRTNSRELAEDLTSRTFLQAYDALRCQSRRIWVSPWIYRIATNVHISHLRSLKCLRERLADIGRHWVSFAGRADRPDDIASDKEQSARVRECLLSMPERYRAVLVLRYDEELAYREIAEILCLSPVTVRKRVERGLRLLEERYCNSDAGKAGKS